MGATAPSRLLPATRDSLQAMAVVQEKACRADLVRLFAGGFVLESWEEALEGVGAVGCALLLLRLFANGFVWESCSDLPGTLE